MSDVKRTLRSAWNDIRSGMAAWLLQVVMKVAPEDERPTLAAAILWHLKQARAKDEESAMVAQGNEARP